VQIGETETVGTADLSYMVVTLNKTPGKVKSCCFLSPQNCFLHIPTKKGIFKKRSIIAAGPAHAKRKNSSDVTCDPGNTRCIS
jgi:hypothetical protein